MNRKLSDLAAIMDRLRDENGCPWDREQTHQSLKPYLIEESYEVVEAIESGNPQFLKEELGDLLFQIIFHCRLAKERGEFALEDVIGYVSEKMIRRHPHVFAADDAKNAEEVLQKWEQIKAKEKGKERESILDGIPRQLPSLIRARRLQERAARVGFDWPHSEDVWKKVEEEWNELQDARHNRGREGVREEMGDVLIALVNLGRFIDVDADDAIKGSIEKFYRRFRVIEQEFAKQGKDITTATLEEMDAIWNEAKRREKDAHQGLL